LFPKYFKYAEQLSTLTPVVAAFYLCLADFLNELHIDILKCESEFFYSTHFNRNVTFWKRIWNK